MGALLKVTHVPKEGKSWVAEIGGRTRKFGLHRFFLVPIAKDWTERQPDGISTYELTDGKLYQVQPSGQARAFVRVVADQVVILDLPEARKALDRLDRGEPAFRTAQDDQIDAAIERVNFTTEGGFNVTVGLPPVDDDDEEDEPT